MAGYACGLMLASLTSFELLRHEDSLRGSMKNERSACSSYGFSGSKANPPDLQDHSQMSMLKLCMFAMHEENLLLYSIHFHTCRSILDISAHRLCQYHSTCRRAEGFFATHASKSRSPGFNCQLQQQRGSTHFR